MAEEKKKDAQKAEEYYREALSLDPNFAEAHTGLGNVLRRLGRDKEALGHLQAGVRYKPDYAEAHNDLGKALVDRGDIDGAARQFEAAQRLKPGLAPAWYNLGAARLRQNRYEEGLDCLMEAVKLASAQHDPNVEEYQKQLDTVRKRLQDFGQTDLIRRVEERRAKRTPPSPRPGATTS
jgi:tetratricopeptide (TPR) repeat protein